MRISGVPVGKVVGLAQGGAGDRRDPAARRRSTRRSHAIARTKAILRTRRRCWARPTSSCRRVRAARREAARGRAAARRAGAAATELDEVTRAFTRGRGATSERSSRAWPRRWTGGTRTSTTSSATARRAARQRRHADDPRQQKGALRRLVHDTGVTFDALGHNQAAVRTLITAGDRCCSHDRRARRGPPPTPWPRPAHHAGRAAPDAGPGAAHRPRRTSRWCRGCARPRARSGPRSPTPRRWRRGGPGAVRRRGPRRDPVAHRAAGAHLHRQLPRPRDARAGAHAPAGLPGSAVPRDLYKQEIVSGAPPTWRRSTRGRERPAAGAEPLHYIRALTTSARRGPGR